MKILLLGSGAREHALARALVADPATTELVVVPGNPGIAEIATTFKADPSSASDVTALAAEMGAELVVVGPEAPLVAGVADALREAGIPVFGPGAKAARLEGSKAFAKEVMAAAGVPTAEAAVCSTFAEFDAALDRFGAPHVVKDDGLAAGKGVVVTSDRNEALAHGLACLAREGGRVLVEDYLDGPEISLFCVCDGATVVPLAPAQDYKRLGDGDAGPNTGGMGSYSPLTWAPQDLTEQVVTTIAQPVVDEMARRGSTFIGLLYCGLALTGQGLRVVEFNVRFGDPETQASAGQKREESGVRTSSPRTSPPSAPAPNSNLVSARMMPRSRAMAAAREYSSRVVARRAAATSAPTMSTTRSKAMFSSWAPTAALAAGVKIGSGSLEASVRPSGSATPHTERLRRYSTRPEPVR